MTLWFLLSESVPLSFSSECEMTFQLPFPPSIPPEEYLTDWTSYYEWRGLDFSSPVAGVLSLPLTVYYVVTTILSTIPCCKY